MEVKLINFNENQMEIRSEEALKKLKVYRKKLSLIEKLNSPDCSAQLRLLFAFYSALAERGTNKVRLRV